MKLNEKLLNWNFYLDLRNVNKYRSVKIQSNPFFSSQQMATESLAEKKSASLALTSKLGWRLCFPDNTDSLCYYWLSCKTFPLSICIINLTLASVHRFITLFHGPRSPFVALGFLVASCIFPIDSLSIKVDAILSLSSSYINWYSINSDSKLKHQAIYFSNPYAICANGILTKHRP